MLCSQLTGSTQNPGRFIARIDRERAPRENAVRISLSRSQAMAMAEQQRVSMPPVPMLSCPTSTATRVCWSLCCSWAALTLACVAPVLAPLHAQGVPPRAVDARLRIQTRQGNVFVGRVVRSSPDSLLLRVDELPTPLVIPQRDVKTFAESLGKQRSRGAVRGALWGGGIGLVILGVAAAADASRSSEANSVGNTSFAAPAGLLLTVLGAGLGAALAPEEWGLPTAVRFGVTRQGAGQLAVGVRWQPR